MYYIKHFATIKICCRLLFFTNQQLTVFDASLIKITINFVTEKKEKRNMSKLFY